MTPRKEAWEEEFDEKCTKPYYKDGFIVGNSLESFSIKNFIRTLLAKERRDTAVRLGNMVPSYLPAKPSLEEGAVAQLILDRYMASIRKNQGRSYHPEGYKITGYCSCGHCHLSFEFSRAICQKFSIPKEIKWPEAKEYSLPDNLNGTASKFDEDSVAYGWNRAIDACMKAVSDGRGRNERDKV